MMKKRILSWLVLAALLLSMASCGKAPSDPAKLQILCTGFAQYDWVCQILGEHKNNVELTLLANNSADLHSYQATVADLASISDCDLLIYIGGTSDQWVEDALKNPRNPNRKTLALMEIADPLEAEHDHEHEEEHALEEHVWLSLKYAERAVNAITALLAELDPANAEDYLINAETYCTDLQNLNSEYQQCVDTAKRKVLLFADRFPFRYLTEDYGLTYYAAFSGCSAESEASFSTIATLAQTLDTLALPTVLVIESSDQVLAETVINNTQNRNQEILIMDSIQAGAQKRVESGETYLDIMKNNLTVLQKALH